MTRTSNGAGVAGGDLLADEFGAGLELEPGDAGRRAPSQMDAPVIQTTTQKGRLSLRDGVT